MVRKPSLSILNRDDMNRIHSGVLSILERTGICFECPEAVALFKAHGAKVDGSLVRIPAEMTEKALQTAPSQFYWEARDPAKTILMGRDQICEPNVGCVYIQDWGGPRRLGTLEDYATVQKLHQSSAVTGLVGANPINPNDIDQKTKHLYMLYEVLKNTDKAMININSNGENSKQLLKMTAMAFGDEKISDKRICTAVSANPLSPLAFGTDTTEAILVYAKAGQVVMVLPCAMSGVTAPVHLFGTVMTQVAETVAGIVLAQLVKPGCPVIAAPCSSITYMKRASYVSAAPEMFLIDLASLDIFHHFYHLPTRMMTGMSESKTMDPQAAYETMQNLMMGILGGAHIIHECLGVLDSIMTMSFEKFIIDEECVSRVFRIAAGMDISEEAMSLDLIDEVGQGSYMTHESTFAHYKENWMPTVADWSSYDTYSKMEHQDIVERAHNLYKERVAAAPETLLDAALDHDLKDYIASIVG